MSCLEFINEDKLKLFLKKKIDPIIITDSNVLSNYPFIKKFKYIAIKPGEDNKTIFTANDIYCNLLELGCNRHSYLIGIGGGIVTDITGYVATTYMRGLRFAFIPTTLLAMVDAAIGGKNGVNYNNYKNMIGTFNSPEYIGICLSFLDTLDIKEIDSGYGEILKYAIGFDKKLFRMLEDIPSSEIYRKEYIEKIINRCIKIKTKIVNKDPLETKGLRKKLNLGHTIGHAIEKYTHEYTHGQAVAIGLYYINNFVNNSDLYINDEYISIKNLILKYFPWIFELNLNVADFIDYIDKDKKSGVGNTIDIVFPNKIGHCDFFTIDKDIFKKHIEMV